MFGHRPVPTVAARDVAGDAYILDVREPHEWLDSHVDGSVHVPMQTLPDRVDELPRDRTITVLCAVGGRSAHVTAWLLEQGFDAVNVDGGIYAWREAGRPIVPGTAEA